MMSILYCALGSQFYSQSGQKVGPRLPAIAGTGQKAIKRELGLEEDGHDGHDEEVDNLDHDQFASRRATPFCEFHMSSLSGITFEGPLSGWQFQFQQDSCKID